LLHKTIKKVTEDIERLHYNTAVSALMILLNGFEEQGGASREDLELFLKLLAPFAPHLTEELWRETFGHASSIHREPWPEYDPKLVQDEQIMLVLQVNGKVRDIIMVDTAALTETTAKAAALASEKVKRALAGATPKKIIYVEKRLVNVVA
jgi:leucyl-tRNA synthetase